MLEAQPSSSSTVLLIVDNTFINTVDNLDDYLTRLKTMLEAKDKIIVTVSGRFGLTKVDSSLPFLEVEDRNKTIFSHGIENHSGYFDEVLLITRFETCNYINSVIDVATENNKTVTKYSYILKEK